MAPQTPHLAESEHPSLAHLSAWTYLALIAIIVIIAAVLFYLLSTCYAPARVNPPLPSETKQCMRYSQATLIQPPERAFMLDGNRIPFYEPYHPPLCTKVTPSNPKLTPVIGYGVALNPLLREKDAKLKKSNNTLKARLAWK
ncbi:hypothetical protein BDZ89DRAFT_1061274 [Hymenopellis radicata]|nr:hypothetical protein BDZ89DRAFT_1061274 [Hymenopellis radicata]